MVRHFHVNHFHLTAMSQVRALGNELNSIGELIEIN